MKIGRFDAGAVRDYPAPIWKTIERSAGKPLSEFSKPTDEAAQAAVQHSTKQK